MTSTPPGTPPTPTWYDVLGVSRDATAAEIKAAWRDATDKFEPGSGAGQFRMFNEAADVLLDPERRAAYDASLGDKAHTGRHTPPHPPISEIGPSTHTDLRTERRKDRDRRREEKLANQASGADLPTEAASRRGLVLLGVLAVLAALAVGAAVWFGLQVRQDGRVADARDNAPAAAERAAEALFSYDYQQLPEDRKRAANYVTPSFGKDYLKNFDQLEKQDDGGPGLAVQTKTVVTATVLGSGVVDAQDNVVRVLVYVNQVSKRPDRDPQIFQNRVAMTMEKDGARWLVDGVKSY